MPLRLYADECVNGRIVAGLRRRGVDIVTTEEQGLLSAPDDRQMDRARELDRAIVTSDRDFLVIAGDLFTRGVPFPGVFFVQPHATIGEAVRSIAEAAELLDPTDVQSWIEWVP